MSFRSGTCWTKQTTSQTTNVRAEHLNPYRRCGLRRFKTRCSSTCSEGHDADERRRRFKETVQDRNVLDIHTECQRTVCSPQKWKCLWFTWLSLYCLLVYWVGSASEKHISIETEPHTQLKLIMSVLFLSVIVSQVWNGLCWVSKVSSNICVSGF